MKTLALTAALAVSAWCQTALLVPSASGQNYSAFATLHRFAGYAAGDGANPRAGLVLGRDGRLYGTTYSGNATGGTATIDKGTVFSISNDGNDYQILHSFNNLNGGGYACDAELTQGSDGRFYGVTSLGGYQPSGNAGQGTVFSITAGGLLTYLHQFNRDIGNDGSYPDAGLVEGRDGKFYGVTAYGGVYNNGTVFAITTGGALTILHSFNYAAGEGLGPQAALVQGRDGKFYGTTSIGGVPNRGTAYSITPDGVFTTLHVFGTAAGDPLTPDAGLIQGLDGKFYGTSEAGGEFGSGTVFSMTSEGVVTVLHSFTPGGENPVQPHAKLVQASDGRFYGTTAFGGINGLDGTVFSITSSGFFNVMHRFNRANGEEAFPQTGLVQGTDGFLYGTTYGTSGSSGNGTVFKIALDATPLPPPLPPVPVVTLTTGTPTVTLGSGQIGKFLLTIPEAAATDLQVTFLVKGSAQSGVDYVALKGRAKLKAGKTSKTVKIKPLGNLGGARKKVIKLTLTPGEGYTVSTEEPAKMKLLAP